MRKIIIILLLTISSSYVLAQDKDEDSAISLKELYIPTSPAFSLLDISTSTIERPATAKAFALSIANAVGQSQGIPKSYAVEIAPFWFFKNPKMNVFKHYGINAGKAPKQNIFHGLKNTSISLGTTSKDSSANNPLNVTYIGYSIKSNIINVRNKMVLKTLYEQNIAINENINIETDEVDSICTEALGIDPTNEAEYSKCLDSITHTLSPEARIAAFNKADSLIEVALNIRPVFSLDAAIASSTAFYDNTFSNNHGYRTGGWLTFSLSHALDKGSRHDIEKLAKAKNYFNAYALVRTLSEDSISDMKTFKRYNYFDYGIRAEFEFNRFAVSFEHVQRKVSHDNSLNSARNVGIVQYKIDDNLYFTGTFGKNFGEQNNLIAFFGISWGLGKTAVYDRFSRDSQPAH